MGRRRAKRCVKARERSAYLFMLHGCLTKGQMTTLVGKIQAHAASIDISVIPAADAKSMAGFKPGLDKVASELCAAEGRGFLQC